MVNARDDLADLIETELTYPPMGDPGDTERVADAVIAAGWRPPARVIETVEELDALPDGSIILGGLRLGTNQRAIQRSRIGWWEIWTDGWFSSSELVDEMKLGPFTVVWEPEAEL